LPESQSAPAPTPGIVLSPRTATFLIVAIILALSLVFIVGMVVGSLLHGSPTVVPSTEDASPAWIARLEKMFWAAN